MFGAGLIIAVISFIFFLLLKGKGDKNESEDGEVIWESRLTGHQKRRYPDGTTKMFDEHGNEVPDKKVRHQ